MTALLPAQAGSGEPELVALEVSAALTCARADRGVLVALLVGCGRDVYAETVTATGIDPGRPR